MVAGAIGVHDKESTAPHVNMQVEELRSHAQKYRPLGSLYSFERDGDKLVFHSSQVNRELQSILGDIFVDEYGSMKHR